MPRCAVLVDAGYLFKAGGALFISGEVRREMVVLDGQAVVQSLSDLAEAITHRELLRVYWYDAAARGPTLDHRAIAELPHVKLRLGHLNSAGQQKGVDPLIITDMITLARNRACEDMVLLSGDADLVVGVLQAQEHGVRVHLLGVTPARANQAHVLRQEADTCQEWNAEAVSRFMRAATDAEIAARQARLTIRAPRLESTASAHVQTASARAGGEVLSTGAGAADALAPAQPVGHHVHPINAEGVASLAGGIPETHLRTVAEALEQELRPSERAEILASPRPGLVPGHIDRRLLGTAKAMLGMMLQEPEKRVLRRLLHEVCAARVAITHQPSVGGSDDTNG